MNHAIIGCGRVAPNHVFGAKEAGVNIKWCCDLNEKKLNSFSAKHVIKNKTTNYLEVINDPEVTSVSICTDHKSHSKIAIDSLRAGKHVLLEKPIAINVLEARKIIKERDRKNLIVSVCFQHRFDPLIQKIKKLIDKNVLGKINAINANIQCSKDSEYYSGWRGKSDTEGGSTLINQGIHTLDLLVWFFGSPEIIASHKDALKFKNNFETEDTIISLLKFKNGALGTFLSTNTSSVEWDSSIEIIGTEGRISFTTDFPNEIIKCDIKGNKKLISGLNGLTQNRNIPPVSMNYYGISHKDVLLNFFKSINGKEELFISAEEGLKTLEVVEKMYKFKFKK